MEKASVKLMERIISLGIMLTITLSPLLVISASFHELGVNNVGYEIFPGSLVYDPNNNYIYAIGFYPNKNSPGLLFGCLSGCYPLVTEILKINPKSLEINATQKKCLFHVIRYSFTGSNFPMGQISVFDPCNGDIYFGNEVFNPVNLTKIKTFYLKLTPCQYAWFDDIFDPITHNIYIVHGGYLNIINARNNTLVKTIPFPCLGALQSIVLSNGEVLFIGMNCNLEKCYLILFNPWNYTFQCKHIPGVLGFLYYGNCKAYIALSNNSILVINAGNLQTINIYNCYNIGKYNAKCFVYIGYCKVINAAVDNGYLFYISNHSIIYFGNAYYGIYDPNAHAFYLDNVKAIMTYSTLSEIPSSIVKSLFTTSIILLIIYVITNIGAFVINLPPTRMVAYYTSVAMLGLSIGFIWWFLYSQQYINSHQFNYLINLLLAVTAPGSVLLLLFKALRKRK